MHIFLNEAQFKQGNQHHHKQEHLIMKWLCNSEIHEIYAELSDNLV